MSHRRNSKKAVRSSAPTLEVFGLFALALTLAPSLLAYGPDGHEIVGAIADELLATKPAGAQITALIDGLSLRRASTMADEIRAWDKNGPDDPNAFPHYADHPKIDRQLREFWRANPPSPDPGSILPSHHWFHYTDVPIVPAQKYSEGKAGRSKWDIVHMIPYCVSVLHGETAETNERKITKPIAVILLAHYVGDIHQPLHVGADYFDESGRETDPDKSRAALGDEGGNTFRLRLSDDPPPHRGIRYNKFHGFWDFDAVNTLLPSINPRMPRDEQKQQRAAADEKIAHQMAVSEPKSWQLPSNVPLDKYAEAWADEILPVAREGHQRLQFSGVHAEVDQGRTVAAGDATEKPEPDRVAYRQWASGVVHDELHKAGWRLADLLEKSVKSDAISSSTELSESKMKSIAAATAATPGPASPYGDYPANYKQIVIAWMKQTGRGL
jgi:hypothetical protein